MDTSAQILDLVVKRAAAKTENTKERVRQIKIGLTISVEKKENW
jgi:hypothetical protein